MTHLIVLYYVLALMAGISGIITAVIADLRLKSAISRLYLFFLLVLTLFVCNNTFFYYIHSVVKYENISLNIFLSILLVLNISAFIYLLPALTFSALNRRFKGMIRITFICLSFLGFVLLLAPAVFAGSPEKVLSLIWAELYNFYVWLFYAVIFYSLGLAFFSLKKVENAPIKKILKTCIIVIIIAIPGFLLDSSWEYFQETLHIIPRGFNFMPLFYLLWNLLSITYTIRFLFTNPAEERRPSLPVLTEAFLKQYDITGREKEIIPLILTGLSNQEISEKLFISLGTVKNHVYHIYQKTGVENRLSLMHLIGTSK